MRAGCSRAVAARPPWHLGPWHLAPWHLGPCLACLRVCRLIADVQDQAAAADDVSNNVRSHDLKYLFFAEFVNIKFTAACQIQDFNNYWCETANFAPKFLRYYSLIAEIFLYKPRILVSLYKPREQSCFSICNHHNCLRWLFALQLNTYVMGL